MLRTRLYYLMFLALCVAFFLFYEAYFSHLLLVFALVLPVVSLLSALPACFLLSGNIRAATPLSHQGMPIGITLTLHNASPLPCGSVRFQLTAYNTFNNITASVDKAQTSWVFPGEDAAFDFSMTPIHCGRLTLMAEKCRVCDVLGIFTLPIKRRFSTDGCCVLPPLVDSLSDGLALPFAAPKAYGQESNDVLKLRDYTPGDRLKHIHWKLSRLDTLIVREYAAEAPQPAWALMDFPAHADADTLDAMVLGVSVVLATDTPLTLCFSAADTIQTHPADTPDSKAAALADLLSVKAEPLSALPAESREAPVCLLFSAGESSVLFPDNTSVVHLDFGTGPIADSQAIHAAGLSPQELLEVLLS